MTATHHRGVDLLTGAYGRPTFERELARIVSSSRQDGTPLALLYVDVDDFQEHWDTKGQAAADGLLAELAGLIAQSTGGLGPLGRLDTDAFAALLPEVDLGRACQLAEGVRHRVGMHAFHDDGGFIHVTVSVGVAGLRQNEPWGNLLDAAEAACVRAKQGGRDRIARR